jgi:hypothetical protein
VNDRNPWAERARNAKVEKLQHWLDTALMKQRINPTLPDIADAIGKILVIADLPHKNALCREAKVAENPSDETWGKLVAIYLNRALLGR